MALVLAAHDETYEDMAIKFFEHFAFIAQAMNDQGLWDEGDGFYYDVLHLADGGRIPLRVRSMVGLIPLFAVEVLDRESIGQLKGFTKRMNWFLQHRQDLSRHISYMQTDGGKHSHYLLAIPSKERLERVLSYLLDEKEFLSPYGIRSLSQVHRQRPFICQADGKEYRVDYSPGESRTEQFGGNSNWRGPVWFPVNYLLIEALERYHHFYGDSLKVEYPTGSGKRCTLKQVARDLSQRLVGLFLPDEHGRRPYNGGIARFDDPQWKELVLFHEYFDGDNGKGLGASHQTGWTALVARLLGGA
jgi:hypothetical protein